MMRTEKDTRGIQLTQSCIKVGLGPKCVECGLGWELKDEGWVLQRVVIRENRCIDGGLQICRDEGSLEMLGEFMSELQGHI